MTSGTARRQRRQTIFGKSLDSLGALLPSGISLSQPVDGTATEQQTVESINVIGRDTQPTSEPFNVKSKPSEPEFDRRKYPTFSVFHQSCCGIMEVAGIQEYMHLSVEEIICGLHLSIRDQNWKSRELSDKMDENYQNQRALSLDYQRGKITPEGYREKYAALINTSRRLQNQRDSTRYKVAVAGAYMFTWIADFDDSRFAKEFSGFAEENKLGTVTVAPAFYNPNSDNSVTTVIWGLNQNEYYSFLRKHLPERIVSEV